MTRAFVRDFLGILLVVAGWGCSPKTAVERPGPQAAALYSEPAAPPAAQIQARDPNEMPLKFSEGFSATVSAFSPATLYHSSGRELHLFTGLKLSAELGGPTYIAFSSQAGPRSFRAGTRLDPKTIEECWLLVWFEGALGWTNWDSPWAVFLQHRPESLSLDDTGLHLKFGGSAENVAVMPLYGYFKPSTGTNDFLAAHGLPSKKVRPARWADLLTRDVLTRVRYWANAMREIPVGYDTVARFDPAHDSLSLEWDYHWLGIDDDWRTPHLKLAPVSPVLGLSLQDKRFAVTPAAQDYDYVTPFGPFFGVENSDTARVTLPVLQVIHETGVPVWTQTNQAAIALQVAAMHSAVENCLSATPNDSSQKPTAEETLRFFQQELELTMAFGLLSAEDHSALRSRFLTQVRAVSSNPRWMDRCREKTRAGRLARSLLTQIIWRTGFVASDTNLVAETWPRIKALWFPSELRDWRSWGAVEQADPPDEAAGALHLTRLAYQNGDWLAYEQGCLWFCQELVRLHLWMRGSEYIRKHQPWNGPDFMGQNAFLDHIDAAGVTVAQSVGALPERWRFFVDPDLMATVNAAYPEEIILERKTFLGNGLARGGSFSNSLFPLLFATPEAPREANLDQSEEPAIQLHRALIRAQPHLIRRFQRLITFTSPLHFSFSGLRNRATAPEVAALSYSLRIGGDTQQVQWPEPIWPLCRTPQKQPWTFGQTRPSLDRAPISTQVDSLGDSTFQIQFKY